MSVARERGMQRKRRYSLLRKVQSFLLKLRKGEEKETSILWIGHADFRKGRRERSFLLLVIPIVTTESFLCSYDK